LKNKPSKDWAHPVLWHPPISAGRWQYFSHFWFHKGKKCTTEDFSYFHSY